MGKTALALLIIGSLIGLAYAEDAAKPDAAADLAKKLANPVAALVSAPFQANYDENIGPADNVSVFKVNIQPVVPFSLNEDWNLISRTILPVVDQSPGESGLGDVVQSLFFSPKEPTESGWILGAGPVLLLPTATDRTLGADEWGLGPTALALKQSGPWTYGALVNHIWSVAGDGPSDVNMTLLQPFVAYITKSKTTLSLNAESTYDWQSDQWAIPLNLGAYQLLKVGKQILQVGGGVRYWAESTTMGPEGLGFRFQMTVLFPK